MARQYKGSALLEYLQENPDRPITTTELARELEWSQSSVSAALSGFLSKYPEYLTREQRGIYTWHSEPAANAGAELTLTIVYSENGSFIAKDMSTGQSFTVKPFDF